MTDKTDEAVAWCERLGPGWVYWSFKPMDPSEPLYPASSLASRDARIAELEEKLQQGVFIAEALSSAPKPAPERNFSLPEGPFTIHHVNTTTGEVTQINPDGGSQPLSGIFGRPRRRKAAPK